ncbi:hypothetical protein ACOT81_33085 [Streptomyces sp. WI04-05B]|uniref:hypothetical protein n=1 Tax=Streptomyces TaxID=1883 RepID=UPI0029B38353|nr:MULTISPECIES: hypothetical protein [unclassified Streptomyces]MDX2547036.1 hypothetical protein [Streptomyces sp. WI04-05B]MDX2589725.1 hypothetical protein [Streptomyces sp. WI04-05A]MDX3753175.1 hypothetical protein [Streptomyces sp. AK08-02]
MPADKVTHGTDVEESRGRTGPRHAAPRKPLFTRFHVPAGKAIALAAMPTAVLMGMGFTPTLARADGQPAKSMTAEEYQKCVEVVTGVANGTDTAATPSAATSSSSSSDDADTTKPSPSATDSGSGSSDDSSDSGSDDAAEPTPTPSASKTTSSGSTGSDKATPTPSASASATEESGGGLLETIGDAITGIFTGGSDSSSDAASTTTSTETTETADSASPTPTASPAPTADAAGKGTTGTTTVKDTKPKVTGVLKDTVKDTTKAAETTTETAEKAVSAAAASPSPSASSTVDPEDCPAEATDDEGGVDNSTRLPVDPWILQASSLTLNGADYQGIVKVRTADGTVKEVLKYVISGGTTIHDLHQIVNDPLSGKTYHAQAAKGTDSTIEGGKTIMYTESISGNLLGLIPVTFSPKSPPPLNIPWIYFTNVKVIQAGQFGGTLTIPGLHQYTT